MADLEVLSAEVNRVTLNVDLEGLPCARIYRPRRKAGPYEAVGTACDETHEDTTDVIPGKTRWQPQFPGLVNPDKTYYWRLCARNAKGVWGAWSEVRSFVPSTPSDEISYQQ